MADGILSLKRENEGLEKSNDRLAKRLTKTEDKLWWLIAEAAAGAGLAGTIDGASRKTLGFTPAKYAGLAGVAAGFILDMPDLAAVSAGAACNLLYEGGLEAGDKIADGIVMARIKAS